MWQAGATLSGPAHTQSWVSTKLSTFARIYRERNLAQLQPELTATIKDVFGFATDRYGSSVLGSLFKLLGHTITVKVGLSAGIKFVCLTPLGSSRR